MVLQFQPFSSAVEGSFWFELSDLKLNGMKLDESSMSISGYFEPGYSRHINSSAVTPVGDLTKQLANSTIQLNTEKSEKSEKSDAKKLALSLQKSPSAVSLQTTNSAASNSPASPRGKIELSRSPTQLTQLAIQTTASQVLPRVPSPLSPSSQSSSQPSQMTQITSGPTQLCVGVGAFKHKVPPRGVKVFGTLKNFNTLESFTELDKTTIFNETVAQIWNDISSGEAIKNPNCLNRFLLLTYADLKKYKFYYWFAFPALIQEIPSDVMGGLRHIGTRLTESQCTNLRELFYSKFTDDDGTINTAFFLVVMDENKKLSVAKLTEYETFKPDQVWFAFVDPCDLATNPGWPLRNFLILIKKLFKLNRITCFCFREVPGKKDISQSLIFEVDIGNDVLDKCPKAIGWEKNHKGVLSYRTANLGATMDPAQLADSSAELNLRLMRWRLLPSLKLEPINAAKVLILGAGTIGTNIARMLIGWGVRNLSLVDNGHVAFSNPVRQPLYTVESVHKRKVEAASSALKEILPSLNIKTYPLSIPMPGHPPLFETSSNISSSMLSPKAKWQRDLTTLENAIKAADIVVLGLDSREGRWWPTVVSAVHKKLVINVAIGFDTFVVMRHGVSSTAKDKQKLGCYFCNDVVAPIDSLTNRTLDEQCTVTRPGVSPIASAIAAELMVSVLQHPLGALAPAEADCDLGVIPHQIRGSISTYSNQVITGHAFPQCTACSDIIIEKYRREGNDFVEKVCGNGKILEKLVGLDLVQKKAEEVNVEWEEEN